MLFDWKDVFSGRDRSCSYYNPTVAKRKSKSPSLFDRMESDANVIARPASGWGVTAGPNEERVSLHEAAQTRYLNYALSVITSRALPDVRDGLKPVQRRILYTMWQQNLTADAKHRKCAKVVGDVMGNYHPHGDAALYETLVRMAQPFSLRYPLIDGSGNFGSLDGDNAAAMRYTECRLARISDEMLSEIDQDTVAFRPNYDGTREEPVVLPARIPNMLINGATGIAVGMATNIPPHNLGEICKALVEMIDADLEPLTIAQLTKHVKGPDFPTGGQIMNTQQEIREIYKTGAGSIRIRATWIEGPASRGGKTIFITSVPYTVNKSTLVERIADIALSRKLPHLVDVKDLSTDDVRIALELKGDADKRMVMAYLYKHTPLQSTFPVNLTCLIPTENALVGKPERLSLHDILWHFLHFRLEVVRARLKYRARVAQIAHPHPRGLRARLRRARRDPEDRPQVRGQGRRRREDHGALQARRRADGRDPRAQDLPPRAPRNPRDPERARREAEAREGNRRPAQARRRSLEDRPHRDRADPEDVRRRAAIGSHRRSA